jgi:hypothetical protein
VIHFITYQVWQAKEKQGLDMEKKVISQKIHKNRRHQISIKYQIPLNTISCFEEIELIKTMVNSLKHRGGYSFTDYSEAGNKFNSVNDSIEHILYLKESAFKFIKELISAIIIIEHENT